MEKRITLWTAETFGPDHWEIWDGIAFEPDSRIFKTRFLAQVEADRLNNADRQWQRAGLADAPHMDAA